MIDYLPFGSDRVNVQNGSFNPENKFTGQKHDQESNLYNYGARYYNPTVGRFNQVDPQVLNDVIKVLSNPQLLNEYSYSGNNPITYTDPTGETRIQAAWGYIQGIAKSAWGTLTMSYYSLVYPDQTREVLQQKAKEAVNAWRATIAGILSNPSQTANEMLQGCGITFDEFLQKSDGEKGEIIGRLAEGAMEIVAAKKFAEVSTIKKTWGNSRTLSSHFKDHGADFGATSEIEYAQKASQFYKNSNASGILKKVDKNGVTRLYDPETNTFGSYNPDGTTKTFYKPDPEIHKQGTNLDYWNNQ